MKKLDNLSKAVIASFAACIIFTITSIILEIKGITLSDTLTQYFFLTFGVEFAATAAIKITKHKIKVKEKELGIKPENIEDFDEYEGGHFYG